MHRGYLIALVAFITTLGAISMAHAQTVPNVKGLAPFTSES